jgi:two-component system sensor histidine kinase MtrB
VDRKGGELAVFAPDEPCIADIDRRRIARIVRNLVGNAIEHGEGVPIQVTVAEHETAVAVSVRDHGVGLKPEQVRMVFHRFWRADPARARTTGGTGLGLAISLEDAHLHGGALGVWGAPKLGAHFVLTVPKRAGDDIVESPIPLVPDLPDVEGADEGLIGESYSGLPTSATVGPE